LPIVLGGGHEAGFGSHRGIYRALGTSPAIVNLDAHLDLRAAERPTNGTPFRQVRELVGEQSRSSVLGVSVHNTTDFLFNVAGEFGADVTTDDALSAMSPQEAAGHAVALVEGAEHIPRAVDLGVLSEALAPGTGSAAAVGVELGRIRAICTGLAGAGRLKL